MDEQIKSHPIVPALSAGEVQRIPGFFFRSQALRQGTFGKAIVGIAMEIRKYAIEAFGTAVLVFVGCGAVTAGTYGTSLSIGAVPIGLAFGLTVTATRLDRFPDLTFAPPGKGATKWLRLQVACAM